LSVLVPNQVHIKPNPVQPKPSSNPDVFLIRPFYRGGIERWLKQSWYHHRHMLETAGIPECISHQPASVNSRLENPHNLKMPLLLCHER